MYVRTYVRMYVCMYVCIILARSIPSPYGTPLLCLRPLSVPPPLAFLSLSPLSCPSLSYPPLSSPPPPVPIPSPPLPLLFPQLLEAYENRYYFQMVMSKHGDGMDLFSFIDSCQLLTEPLTSYMFRQVVSALDYLHQRSILHRDIKVSSTT